MQSITKTKNYEKDYIHLPIPGTYNPRFLFFRK